MSQQNGMGPSNQAPVAPNMLPPQPNLNMMPPNFPQFLKSGQIGVDPGYYSDSECSSNSSERTEEAAQAGQQSPEEMNKKFLARTKPAPQQTPMGYNWGNDYFGFNDMVNNGPSRSAFGDFMTNDDSPWKPMPSAPVKERNSSDSSSSSSSGCLSPLAEQAEYPRSTPSPSLQNIMMKKTANKRAKPQVCVFCRNNGEDESVYATHALKNAEGNVTCPILHAYECPICRATGDQAHTLKYCPRNPNGQQQQQINALAKINNASPVPSLTSSPFNNTTFTPFNPLSFANNTPNFSNPPAFPSNPMGKMNTPFPSNPPQMPNNNNNFNNNMMNNMFPANMFPNNMQFNMPPPPFNMNMPAMPQTMPQNMPAMPAMQPQAPTTPLPAATPESLTPLPQTSQAFQFDWLNSSSSHNEIDSGLSHLLGKANLEDIFPGLLSR